MIKLLPAVDERTERVTDVGCTVLLDVRSKINLWSGSWT